MPSRPCNSIGNWQLAIGKKCTILVSLLLLIAGCRLLVANCLLPIVIFLLSYQKNGITKQKFSVFPKTSEKYIIGEINGPTAPYILHADQ